MSVKSQRVNRFCGPSSLRGNDSSQNCGMKAKTEKVSLLFNQTLFTNLVLQEQKRSRELK